MENIPQSIMNQTTLLDQFQVIKATGTDVRSFLQNQLTQDINECRPDQAQYAAWASPKGRILATFLIWPDARDSETHYLLLKKDIAESTLKRLQMFVLRAQVQLTLIESSIAGFVVPTGQASEPSWMPAQPLAISHDGTRLHIRCYDEENVVRCYVFDPAGLSCPASKEFDAFWGALDIEVGLAWVDAKNRERFLAQSLNYDALNIVSFKKGCYPGQEVIARSHYRGKIKRRSIIGVSQAEPLELPVDVFSSDEQEPAGEVVSQSYIQSEGNLYLLLEVRLESLESTSQLVLGNEQRTPIQHKLPPYSLEKPQQG